MPIENWSADTVIVRLGDDPLFSEELRALKQDLARRGHAAVLDFGAVTFLNSTNLSLLLALRRRMIELGGRLVLCGVSAGNWGTFLVTGLDRIFTFRDDIATSLATLHLLESPETPIEDAS